MKFSDGYWQTRPGFTVLRPIDIAEVTSGPDYLQVLAPAKPSTGRGWDLNLATATLTLSSPMTDVIKVRIEHHSGALDPGPHFVLPGAGPTPVRIRIDDTVAELTSGDLSAVVRRGEPLRIDFRAGGRTLTSSLPRGIGLVTDDAAQSHVFQQLSMAVGDLVYGLGERFGPVVKNGQTVDIWNEDGGTASEQAYKNVPFYLTNAGYGVFVNHPERVSFEIGSEAVSRNQFSVPGQHLEYFVIHGPSPKQILSRYTALTGRPPQVPSWSFGLWLSTSFTTSYDEATVSGFIAGMAEREIPLSVFHFDCYWMRGFRLCDLEWDPVTFPEPEAMLARLKADGLKVCVWINPYIAQQSALFAEGRDGGYLVKRPDGSVWQWDMWQAGMALVDFTNPDAVRWYTGHLGRLLDQGVDAFKTDFGERIPIDVVWHDGSDPLRMHNYYTQLYNRAVYELLRQRRGDGEAVLFARSATAGGQQFPVHWGGDSESNYPSMAETLRGGLSLAYSGFGYWSHDIGGFEGTPDPAVFKRWLPFGLLSSHSRLHGSGSVRAPWAFGEEAVDVARKFTRLKLSLMPYLARIASETTDRGYPMLRPMLLEFPDDRTTAHLDTQYMLGDSLLVAPVFSDDGDVEYYVPEGVWTHLLTGGTVTGPRWVRETHGYDSVPLLVRPGTVLPVAADDGTTEFVAADGVILHLFELAVGFESTVAAGSARFHVRRTSERIVVTRTAGTGPWSVVLDGEATPAGGDVWVH
ncbi:alpha-D-xyloside xylohydrolase [Nakamurella panacisegetis]|uniref:alpha-D-xyloside xylohydrolase n=1 Tax=Nakamurella panacisegetis TaxID=1090615 RepID=A0A1H0KCN9_9ACTN|nr:alpha-xylosidase [Nakamurella panacisegetis]SDO53606.1 alpha-D-xyloside xylohydrolase [Nakamurella panacisegetis]